MSFKNIRFHNYISSVQKVALYETRNVLYLIASNNRESRFRVLEIDRTSPDLKVYEHPNEKESRDIRRFVSSLNFTKAISAYGILGFVRFTAGYYLILVTKRTMCALVGQHIIYTIKDTVMIRINEDQRVSPMEQKYLKLFGNVDLNSNFYFSYSYNLSRTLQYNLSLPMYIEADEVNDGERHVDGIPWERHEARSGRVDYAVRGKPRRRFIWNEFLAEPVRTQIHPDWLLEIIHGFIGQSNISIFGRPIYVCLIARRSTRFAGTRFLKRGANISGDVANEVETEQIVADGTRICSFVQMRGSIPLRWSQDVSKMVPKPPISIDIADPYSDTAGRHFARLFFHYGAPIIVLNLVKKREKKVHENILTREMVASIRYLNQFLPVDHRIRYIHFDMAKRNRIGNVMKSLASIAETVVQQTGIFFQDAEGTTYQTGIVRVNCVDCLDRTNTAQFAIGKCVLGHQLARLGFVYSSRLQFDSDCITMLESLYEDHGDTLALQYGGSQLVHRIKTYRKTAPWTSQGNDIMQTLSRYYSNTFSDTEKQHSINLFLGIYLPTKADLAAESLPNDHFYFQNVFESRYQSLPLTQWLDAATLDRLPMPASTASKVVKELIKVESQDVEMVDSYSNYHQPFKMTSFEETIAYQISQVARHFVSTFKTNFSPFEPSGRRQDRERNNPSLTGQSSTGSTNSSSVDEDSSSTEGDDDLSGLTKTSDSVSSEKIHARRPLPITSCAETYGVELKEPSARNMEMYERYVASGEHVTYERKGGRIVEQKTSSIKLKDNSAQYKEYPDLVVSEESVEIYRNYVNLLNELRTSERSLEVIKNYASLY